VADNEIAAVMALSREVLASVMAGLDDGLSAERVAIRLGRAVLVAEKNLAAVDEVLALADKWTGDAGNQLVIVYNDPAMNEAAAAVSHKSASVRRTLAAEVRAAVLTALTGKGGDGADPE
jgi:hypothetical protein